MRAVIALILCAMTSGCMPGRPPADHTPVARAAAVDREASEELARMARYMRTLPYFEVVSQTIMERGLDNGEHTRSYGRLIHRFHRPNRFFVESQDDRNWRQFIYDGRAFTMVAPRSNFHTKIIVPASLSGALQAAAANYEIEVPLSNLLLWSVSDRAASTFGHATTIGPARINSVDATQYAFRTDGMEWRIWIASGPRPLPQKIVITSLGDHPRRAITALLTWNLTEDSQPGAFSEDQSQRSRRIPIRLAAASASAASSVGFTAPASTYTLPDSCVMAGRLGATYYNCGGVWYEPRFVGATITYTITNPPRQAIAMETLDRPPVRRNKSARLWQDVNSPARAAREASSLWP